MSDVNDNAPKFELPDYQAHNVAEDLPIGTSILKVKAADADSGSNADIEYYVSDDHFTVSSKGIVSNAKRLVSYIIFYTRKFGHLWQLISLPFGHGRFSKCLRAIRNGINLFILTGC